MHHIFPLHETACELEERYNDFINNGGMLFHKLHFTISGNGQPDRFYIVDKKPKMIEWRNFLKTVMDDYLNKVLHWTTPTTKADELLHRIIPGYIDLDEDAGKSVAEKRRITEALLTRDMQALEKARTTFTQYPTTNLPPADHTTYRIQRSWGKDDGRLLVEYVPVQNFKAMNEISATYNQTMVNRFNTLSNRVESHRLVLAQLALEEQNVLEKLQRQECSEQLYIDVLVPMMEKVEGWVEALLDLEDQSMTSDMRWRTWLLQDVGDDIDIQMGEDFRILDWMEHAKDWGVVKS